MEVIDTTDVMQKRCEDLRLGGQTIALVPTMGFFHEGHLELMRVGKQHADRLIISIFEAYPRDMEGDLTRAQAVGVDLVFAPSVEEMYPDGFQTGVAVEKVTKGLCGTSRPGHFDGVTTVVAKLFHITKPHLAVFGQKDFQQLTVIRRMVKDLSMDIQILGVPTVREADGLAMSSRNSYLSPDERKSALCLKKSLDLADDMVMKGEKDVNNIRMAVEKLITSYPFPEIDYISICHPTTLEDIESVGDESLLALAVRVGKTRLIDNRLIGSKKDEV